MIRIGNLHYLSVLQENFIANLNYQIEIYQPVKLPFYNFICNLIEIYRQFITSSLTIKLNEFIIQHYIKKYHNNKDLCRFFMGMINSWKKYSDHYEDAKLLLSMLTQYRNDKQTIKKFLKLRKYILKNIDSKILQQIWITHEDALTICHTYFKRNFKSFIIKKINQLFISLNRKLINNAKVNGAVICEFFINCEQLYKKLNIKQLEKKQQMIPQKQQQQHILSFNEQFANCYMKNNENQQNKHQIILDNTILKQKKYQENKFMNFNKAKFSLEYLKDKNKQLDNRFQKSTSYKLNQQYPQGWDNFIKTNKIMKQKLLKISI